MPARRIRTRPAMFNTPQIRTGGFGALQVEAITNRPLSIARRHLAASQLRMRDIEPDELSSSEWVRFLVMEERERDRWIAEFARRRRNSDESTGSADSEGTQDKSEEARLEAVEASWQTLTTSGQPSASSSSSYWPSGAASSATASSSRPTASTPAVSLWALRFDEQEDRESPASFHGPRRPMHRRAVTESLIEAPPTYESAVRPRTPPPAYEPRSDDEGMSPRSPRYVG